MLLSELEEKKLTDLYKLAKEYEYSVLLPAEEKGIDLCHPSSEENSV